jgi:hypothetical protein
MTTEHTPGPWQQSLQFIVAPDPDGIHPDIYIAEIAIEDGEGRIASPEQQAANGRLIVAAPKILAALRRAEFLMRRVSDGDHRALENLLSAADQARAAIAEATGELPSSGDRTVTIEVRGGVVQEVSNVPPGWDYEIIDYDNAE